MLGSVSHVSANKLRVNLSYSLQSYGANVANNFRAALRRPYTKKKNAASMINKSVPPNIQSSYERSEVICAAGKKATAMEIGRASCRERV